MFCWHKWSVWSKAQIQPVKNITNDVIYHNLIQKRVCSKCNKEQYSTERIEK